MIGYETVLTDIYSVFHDADWVLEAIKTVPQDYVQVNAGTEFIRVSVLPSGAPSTRYSRAGMLIIDIFTPAGNGPKRAFAIADRLNAYLESKTISTIAGCSLQLQRSVLSPTGEDRDNPALSKALYSIPFQYFGVN